MDVHFGTGEIAVITTLLGAVVAALTAIFRLLMAAKDAQIADLVARLKNSDSVGGDAVRMMQIAMEQKRAAEGMPSIKPLAPVIPEHQSPVTEAEEATARQATRRAEVTAAALELGVPGRKANTEQTSEPPETHVDLVSKLEAVAAVLALPARSAPIIAYERRCRCDR